MMGWPQGIMLFFIGLTVVVASSKHGEARVWNGPVAFVDAVITLALLWWGGFFA